MYDFNKNINHNHIDKYAVHDLNLHFLNFTFTWLDEL